MKESNTTLFKVSVILDHLLIDARQSLKEIAKKCGTYRQKVWREMKTLEENNTIWGYTPVINEEKLGWKLFFIFLKTKPMTKELSETQIERIKKDHPGTLKVRVLDVYYLNGRYDWIVIFTAKDWICARKYYDNLRKVYGPHLLDKPEMSDVMFSTMRWGKMNPEIDELNNFVSP